MEIATCRSFPQGIPFGVYPWGCVHEQTPQAVMTIGFKPKSGMEEIIKRWKELA